MGEIRAGLVGVGPVGDRIYQCVRERELPLAEPMIVMATSERKEMLGGEEVLVRKVSEELFEAMDIVFFAGREGAKGASVQWGQTAIDAGAYVIDNGSDFRLEPDIPRVVPEVNMDAVTENTRFIASPNCSTIQMCVALAPLHRAATARRIVASTYQSASGWGARGQEELCDQLRQFAEEGRIDEWDPCVFCRPLAGDCIPHIDAFLDNLYTKEEMKMVYETQKIFGDRNIDVTATAVRVPVEIGHAEALNIQFEDEMNAEMAMEILQDPAQSPGVTVIDGPTQDPHYGTTRDEADLEREWMGHRYIHERQFPTQADILCEEYKDETLVGRIRDDETAPNTINLWCVADNLRKGAATNVVQIAEAMLQRGIIG
ncbi:MAG: aspartate-semialdehyde dehydrogenase [Armatimonadota bacterium]